MSGLFTKMLQGAKKENKGFTLVEMLVAIILLAIVVTPVMNSFIVSSKVNMKARKIMIATDIAQDIVEGYSDKTYQSVLSAVNSSAASSLNGRTAFTTYNNSEFNVSANWTCLTDKMEGYFDDSFTTSYISVKTTDPAVEPVKEYTSLMISENTVTDVINEDLAYEIQKIDPDISQKKVYYAVIPARDSSGVVDSNGEGMVLMAYTNLDGKGKNKFNAIVTIIPTASSLQAKNSYFSYSIKVSLYYADTGFTDKVVTMLGGMPNM